MILQFISYFFYLLFDPIEVEDCSLLKWMFGLYPKCEVSVTKVLHMTELKASEASQQGGSSTVERLTQM